MIGGSLGCLNATNFCLCQFGALEHVVCMSLARDPPFAQMPVLHVRGVLLEWNAYRCSGKQYQLLCVTSLHDRDQLLGTVWKLSGAIAVGIFPSLQFLWISDCLGLIQGAVSVILLSDVGCRLRCDCLTQPFCRMARIEAAPSRLSASTT